MVRRRATHEPQGCRPSPHEVTGMLQRRPHAPSLVLLTGIGLAARVGRRRDEPIRVGSLPRTDTFRIGAEVLPQSREDLFDYSPDPRPAA
jgi:hypothetical protein